MGKTNFLASQVKNVLMPQRLRPSPKNLLESWASPLSVFWSLQTGVTPTPERDGAAGKPHPRTCARWERAGRAPVIM